MINSIIKSSKLSLQGLGSLRLNYYLIAPQNMLRIGKTIQYNITNPKIFHNKLEIKRDPNLSFYPLVGFKEIKLGAMTLNKPDNNNMMNEECSDELFRFLNSYHHDHTVENIWVENKGKMFLGGADFDQLKQNQLYLDKLHRLAIMIARLNKPVFAKVNGGVRGISAYVLTMLSTPIATENSSLRLDETTRGFIPIFGGTHRLNRLPCNLGLYLALTGDKLDHHEMIRLGFLKAAMNEQFTNKAVRKNLSDANLFMQTAYTPNTYSLSELRRQGILLEKMKKFEYFIGEAQKDIFEGKRNFNGKFALNQYHLAKVDYENIRNPYNSLSDKNVRVNNYFEMRHDRPFKYLKDKEMIEEARVQDNLLSSVPADKLIKIFQKNSLKEVLEALKEDGSAWAKKTEQIIRSKDPLAQLLTFALIKEGRQSSWIQCLQREYTVAKRLIDRSDVKIVQHDGGSLKIFVNEHSGKQIEQITAQELEEFLTTEPAVNQKFEHDSPQYALYPTSDYWKKVPDSGRHYLNRTIFDDIHLPNHPVEVRRFLQLNKIDYRDRSYNLETMTRSFYQNDMYERLFGLEKQRLRAILNHPISLKRIKKERKQLLDQKKNEKEFSELIQTEVKKYFKKRFDERYNDLLETADIAGKETKMDIFRSYVDTMTENIVLKGRQYEDRQSQSALFHGGIIRFDKNGKNVFEAESDWENSNPALVELKELAKRRGNVDELSQQAQETQKTNDLIFKREKSDWELSEDKKNQQMIHYYHTNILDVRFRARQYRSLIEKAALTSYEMYELLGWENTDIQATLENAPRPIETFRSFAEKALNYEDNTQKKIEELNENFRKVSQLKLTEFLKNEENRLRENGSEMPIFFDLQSIPRPFKQYTLNILKEVLAFFTERYEKERVGNENHKKGSTLINQWVENSYKADLTEFLKYDVQYVFSYLATLQIKQMITEVGFSKNMVEYYKKYGVSFEGYSDQRIHAQLMKFFYHLVDLHGEAKHRIIMPQTKLMDFLARKKITKQLNDRKGLTYQSIVTLIAKDRKRLHDYLEGKTPLLGYEPEHTLNLLQTQKQTHKEYMPPVDETHHTVFYTDLKEQQLESLKLTIPKRKKRLVVGFNGYLMRFESLLQKIAGSDMFLPQHLRRETNKKAYTEVKQLLKINISHEQWVKDKLQAVIKSLLEFRFEKEKNMTKGELALFDEGFSQAFSPEMISALINFEGFKEEIVARQLVEEEYSRKITKQEEENTYFDIKKLIKNPSALKMVNNLVMAKNTIKDRFYELEEDAFKKNPTEEPTGEELSELSRQMEIALPTRTTNRLLREAMRYKDDESPNNLGNKDYTKKLLGIGEDKKMISHFMGEISDIIGTMETDDFTTDLTKKMDRIRKADL